MTDLSTAAPCWFCAFDHTDDACPDAVSIASAITGWLRRLIR